MAPSFCTLAKRFRQPKRITIFIPTQMSRTISTTNDSPNPADEQRVRTNLRQSNVQFVKPTTKHRRK
jgi:hypothetical protein